VPNWSISRNYKNIWNSTKDSVTTVMCVTHRPRGAKPKSMGHKSRSDGPTPWPGSHTLRRFRPKLDGYAPMLVCKSVPCLRVSGDWEEWLADNVDGRPTTYCRPAIHHLQIDLIKSMEAPLDLYVRILMVELTHTTLYL
jgi:hypothetical protein